MKDAALDHQKALLALFTLFCCLQWDVIHLQQAYTHSSEDKGHCSAIHFVLFQ